MSDKKPDFDQMAREVVDARNFTDLDAYKEAVAEQAKEIELRYYQAESSGRDRKRDDRNRRENARQYLESLGIERPTDDMIERHLSEIRDRAEGH